jgi:hypothetical protein
VATFSITNATIYLFLGMSFGGLLSRSGTFFKGDCYDTSGSSLGILKAAISRQCDPVNLRSRSGNFSMGILKAATSR